jgi:hypothetical protein
MFHAGLLAICALFLLVMDDFWTVQTTRRRRPPLKSFTTTTVSSVAPSHKSPSQAGSDRSLSISWFFRQVPSHKLAPDRSLSQAGTDRSLSQAGPDR